MILKSFLLGNLLSLCMKIINSVVVVGLYYGFLTTFSIGPSYLFLLRARVMEEGTEKEISATTGFITGQLMMFISIYYAPLHLALGRPHTITVLVLPYLLFHFFWNNKNKNFYYGSTTNNIQNSMRNPIILCVFLNNLIFQLFNHFILPSSTLFRLVNIYMFRCNNKILFVTSGFVGWLMGHILFIKWVEFILVWIRQNHFIRSNFFRSSFIQSDMYFVSELKNYLARIFSTLLFITSIYYLGRMPLPIFTTKLKNEENSDVEITSENKTEESEEYEDIYQEPWELESEENQETPKNFVTFLFDYKRWNRPFRYIENDQFEKAVRNEVSQYFFYTCASDGKQRISFTYPPSLSTFSEMIEQKISLYKTEKIFHENNDLFNRWVYTNEQKKHNLSNELINRIKTLEKKRESFVLDVLEKRTRLYNDESEEGYLSNEYDPFLNGPYRGKTEELDSPSTINDLITSTQDSIKTKKINDLLPNDYKEFKDQKNPFIDFRESSSIYIDDSLTPTSPIIDSKNKNSKFLFDIITNDENTSDENDETILNQFLTKMSKKVPRWSYKLTSELEELEEEEEEEEEEEKEKKEEKKKEEGEDGNTDQEQKKSMESHGIRSRKARRVVIYTDKDKDTTNDDNSTRDGDSGEEVALIRYSQQPDFRRDLIKGSMRAQRRKTGILKMFQTNVHSPLFLNQVGKTTLDFSEIMNLIFRNWIGKKSEIANYDYKEEIKKRKENKKNRELDQRITISETWDTVIFAQPIRGFMLVTQSIFRKYITLPFLIIVKNIGRMLLLQFPEWNEDLRAWNKEMHVKCTYNGIPLSETEFPKKWLTDGIQIKIVFPFRLKPWKGAKIGSHHRDRMEKEDNFCFLTISGSETKRPFGSAQKPFPFFEPIFNDLKEKIIKEKNKGFLKVSKRKIKEFSNISRKKIKRILKKIIVIKERIKELAKKSLIFLLEFYKVNTFTQMKGYEVIEKEKDYIISRNKNIQELIVEMESLNWTKVLLVEKEIKNVIGRIIITRHDIEEIKKEKKNIVIISDKDIINTNKTNLNDKKSKNIWQIFRRKNILTLYKLDSFLKSLIERIYIDILIYIINIFKTNVQIYLESKKKINNNDKTSQEELSIDQRNKNGIPFILTIKKSFSNTNLSNKKPNLYCDLSSLSQAYVFYKISQIQQISNEYQLRHVFQYHGTHLFFKDGIKDSCKTQRILDSKSKHNKIYKSSKKTKEWKNWLKKNYQYNLSETKGFQLVPQKWRNKINQYYKVPHKNLIKWDSYKKEKSSLIHYVKHKYYGVNSRKEKWKKNYRYNFLLHKYINYNNRKDSYIYELPVGINKNQEIPYLHNFNTHKPQTFYVLRNIDISNYLRKKSYRKKNMEKKYFNCKIFHFLIRKNNNINTWTNIHTGTKIKKNTKNRTDNYQEIYKKYQKIYNINPLYLRIHQKIQKPKPKKQKNFFDWMGMNQERLNHRISNLKPWFFSEFGIFDDTYNAYRVNPWIIPTKLLLLNFDETENISQNKNINENKKNHILSNKKGDFELEKRKQQKQQLSQADFEPDVQNQKKKKDIEKKYVGSKIKKKKKYKNKHEAELELFLQKYFLFQLRWNDFWNQRILKSVKVCCFLLRIENLKEMTISSIERGEMDLDVILTDKEMSTGRFIGRGIFIIEPIRLSTKWDEKFIMYQILGISLIDKNKYQTNRKYIKKKDVDMNYFEKPIAQQHNSIFVNENKNDYDFFIPEHIISTRHRRKLRILLCFNSWNRNATNAVSIFGNENSIKSYGTFMNEGKYPHTNITKLIQLKFFIWPNYRLEDLVCMNRYWFNTHNGNRFTMSRIHMYPRFKLN